MKKKQRKIVKTKNSKEELLLRKEIERNKTAFRDFLPITDIRGGCFVDKDGFYYPVIRIGTKNLGLMSKEDKSILASHLEEIFGSLRTRHYQISIVPMPYDISKWNENMSNLIEDISLEKQDTIRSFSDANEIEDKKEKEWSKELLKKKRIIYDARLQIVREQKNWVTDNVQSGRLSTKKCYLILDYGNITDARTAQQKIKEVINIFANKEIETFQVPDKELRLVLNVICNPIQTTSHSIQSSRIPPTLR